MKKVIWEVAYASFGGIEYLRLLTGGWEPFAVSPSGDEFSSAPVFVWFRRQAPK